MALGWGELDTSSGRLNAAAKGLVIPARVAVSIASGVFTKVSTNRSAAKGTRNKTMITKYVASRLVELLVKSVEQNSAVIAVVTQVSITTRK